MACVVFEHSSIERNGFNTLIGRFVVFYRLFLTIVILPYGQASQNEFARSRSIFERALDVDPRSNQLWLSYTEMELKSRNVQHARNLFDRAVTLLPRVDQLWYKYVYLEELLQNVPGARQVFERWMKWEPDDKAWQAYIKLEERYQELDRASAIYERWVAVRPEPRVWVKWGKYEEDRSRVDKAREVFQTALEFYGDEEEQVEKAQAVFSAFAKMETRLKEYDRARVIYKVSVLRNLRKIHAAVDYRPQFALSRIPRSKSAGLYASYTKFEKQHGTRTTLENTVLGKRRIQYEEELSHDGRNYDAWFDYARLEEGAYRDVKEEGATSDELDAAVGRVREVYERAVAQVPPGGEKRHWRRYIFLWLDYALFEEIETKVSGIFLILQLGLLKHKNNVGLFSSATGLPNSNFSGATQAIHLCKTVDYVCEI